jgi:hypothetical protein
VDDRCMRQALLYISKPRLHPYALLDLIGSSWSEGSPPLGVLVGPVVSDSVSVGNDTRFYHGYSGLGAWNVKAYFFAEN